MLIYLLKANIALTLFYLAYRFGLRRLTFYVLNRFFLLAGIVISALFPFIDPAIFFAAEPLPARAIRYVPDLSLLNARPATPLINVVLLYVFWTGVIVMGIRLIIQLLSLWKLHSNTVEENGLRVTERKITPFSFLRNIYINPALHEPVELAAILRHEEIHVKQLHTLDVMLGELNKIFYWFNPGAWLMSMAIRENLEFITDRCILQQGMDVKVYQYSLIKVSGIPYATAIANNFNFSHLKKRIMMMNKKKSSQYHLLRYLVLGSMVGIALLSLNISRAGNRSKSVIVADTTAPVVKHNKASKVPPPPPPAPVAPVAPASTALPVPPPPPPAPLPPPPPPPAPGSSFTFTTTVDANGHQTIVDPPLYIVDGVSKGHTNPNLKNGEISSISIVKSSSNNDTGYGEDGKNGVIYIYTNDYARKYKDTADVKNLTLTSPAAPIYFIDGRRTSPEEFKLIPPGNIASVSVWKDDSAIKKYGSEGANGVIEITLKK